MIQTKQELIDQLKMRIEGGKREIAKMQDDHFNRPTIRWYEGRNDGLGVVVNQLERELREEALMKGEEEEPEAPQPDVLPDLPEGCLETGRTIVRSYLTPEGGSQYTIHTRGRRDKFEVIGGLEVAKYEILAKWEDLDA